jgi:hypothetical protein
MTGTDPIKFVESLDIENLRARLEHLDREGRALRVLLRSALARESAARRRQVAPARKGAAHA